MYFAKKSFEIIKNAYVRICKNYFKKITYKEAKFFSRLDPIQYQKYNMECRHPAQLQWFEI